MLLLDSLTKNLGFHTLFLYETESMTQGFVCYPYNENKLIIHDSVIRLIIVSQRPCKDVFTAMQQMLRSVLWMKRKLFKLQQIFSETSLFFWLFFTLKTLHHLCYLPSETLFQWQCSKRSKHISLLINVSL